MDKNKNLSLKKFNSIKHLIKLLFEEGNPSGIKSALSSMNLCKNILRLPLTVVSNDLGLNIKNSISLFYK